MLHSQKAAGFSVFSVIFETCQKKIGMNTTQPGNHFSEHTNDGIHLQQRQCTRLAWAASSSPAKGVFLQCGTSRRAAGAFEIEVGPEIEKLEKPFLLAFCGDV